MREETTKEEATKEKTTQEKKAHERMHFLSSLIQKYNKEYYMDDAPTISDSEYDLLFLELQQLEKEFPQFETKDSPTKNVGAVVQTKFEKFHHARKMYSLSNCFTADELEIFLTRSQKFLRMENTPISVFCEPKIDGISFSLFYKKGKLTVASTRGDGIIGENITQNVKTIKGLPHTIDCMLDEIEIRGEIFIDKNDFIELNNQQKINNHSVFANPRNAAAGSVRQLDWNITKERPLKYFTYAIGHSSQKFADNQQDLMIKLKKLGFAVNPLMLLAENHDEMIQFYNQILSDRDNLPYEIDGIVYKINDFMIQNRLGYTTRSPRFAIAYKFPAIVAKTKLLGITIQVGRTGALTPVAELETVSVGGVNISRATLHNFQEIEKMDIRIGDTISIYRAGDVIPKILAVDKMQRSNESKKIIRPEYCPDCKSKIVNNTDDVILRCNNGLNCLSQLEALLVHFVSKQALNIDGMGPKQIDCLLKEKMISNISDIFNLQELNQNSQNKLENMPRWGEKSVDKLFKNIDSAKKTSLSKFIFALGIKNIGENNAKLLAQEFRSAENFFLSLQIIAKDELDQNLESKISSLDGVGDKILKEIRSFASCVQNIETVKNLLNILEIDDYQDNISNNMTKSSNILAGKKLVFTGKLDVSRQESKNIAQRLGAKVMSMVSTNTDIVIAGKESGSKLKKAKELGVKVISEEEWQELSQIDI